MKNNVKLCIAHNLRIHEGKIDNRYRWEIESPFSTIGKVTRQRNILKNSKIEPYS